jgi:hypothetical protein
MLAVACFHRCPPRCSVKLSGARETELRPGMSTAHDATSPVRIRSLEPRDIITCNGQTKLSALEYSTMNALPQLAVTLTAFGIFNCAPASPAVVESTEPWVTRPAAKTSANSTHKLANVELAVVYWPSMGQRIAVTIRDTGGSYHLTAQPLTRGNGLNRSWTIQVARTAKLEHLLSNLNPLGLTEKDPCARSWRDGTSWIVMNVVDGTKTIRNRDANGTLALDECKSFDDACRQIMQMAGMTCAIGKSCVLAGDRVPMDAGTQ